MSQATIETDIDNDEITVGELRELNERLDRLMGRVASIIRRVDAVLPPSVG